MGDSLYRFNRGGAVIGCHIHQVQQQAGTHQVFQESDTQAGAFSGTFNQARNIGNHETLVRLHTDHAQIGNQRGERIIRHFRTGRRNRADKGGLTCIGQTQQTNIRQHFQLQTQVTQLAFRAFGGLARRAVNR